MHNRQLQPPKCFGTRNRGSLPSQHSLIVQTWSVLKHGLAELGRASLLIDLHWACMQSGGYRACVQLLLAWWKPLRCSCTGWEIARTKPGSLYMFVIVSMFIINANTLENTNIIWKASCCTIMTVYGGSLSYTSAMSEDNMHSSFRIRKVTYMISRKLDPNGVPDGKACSWPLPFMYVRLSKSFCKCTQVHVNMNYPRY